MNEQVKQHTPGPWECTLSDSMADDWDAWLVVSDESDIAEITSPGDTAEANANLIAAAPELLVACKDSLAFVKHALEFFGWSAFPNLQGEVEKLGALLTGVVAKVEGK